MFDAEVELHPEIPTAIVNSPDAIAIERLLRTFGGMNSPPVNPAFVPANGRILIICRANRIVRATQLTSCNLKAVLSVDTSSLVRAFICAILMSFKIPARRLLLSAAAAKKLRGLGLQSGTARHI